MGNLSSSVPRPVHAESKDGGGRRNSACGGFGVAQQMAPHTYRHTDDTVIMAENECGMQRNLNLLNEYCNCNGLRVKIR